MSASEPDRASGFAGFMSALGAEAIARGDREPFGLDSQSILEGFRLAGQTWPVGPNPWRLEHARDFLALRGRAFLAMAYRTLLLRNPDRLGALHFLDKKGGVIRRPMALLVRLRWSREGRSRHVQVRGLWRAVLIEQFARVPWSALRVEGSTDIVTEAAPPTPEDSIAMGDESWPEIQHAADQSTNLVKCKRGKIVAAIPFPLWPPRSGGQLRAFHLYRELARVYDVHAVCLTDSADSLSCGELASGFFEWRVPRSPAHALREAEISVSIGVSAGDIALPELLHLTPAFPERLRRVSRDAVAIVCCHPYLYPIVREVAAGVPVWYDAQDVETELKGAILPPGPARDYWLSRVHEVESDCCTGSARVLACSVEDAAKLRELFGLDAARVLVVPNGADAAETAFVDADQRARLKHQLGVVNVPMALFIGSPHPPNIEALHALNNLAKVLPEVRVVVAGAVAYSLRDVPSPNLWLVGDVSDQAKAILLQTVDVAMNPLTSGSGTGLKMLEFMASGIPVVTTPVGARGLDLVGGRDAIVTQLGEFPGAVRDLLANPARRTAVARNARQLLESRYTWKAIGDRLLADLQVSAGGPTH